MHMEFCPDSLQAVKEDLMARRLPASFTALAIALLPASAMAQTQSTKKPASTVGRTPDGKPDLQGFWDFRTLTPLERPVSQADKAFLTEEEAGAVQKQNTDRRARAAAPTESQANARKPGGGAAAVGGYND